MRSDAATVGGGARVTVGEVPPPLAHELLEPIEIELTVGDGQAVARWLRQQTLSTERLPQLRDVALERLPRSLRRPLAPEVVDQVGGRNRTVSAQKQKGEECARLRGRQWDEPSLDDRFDRPEDAKFDQVIR